jgi:3-methyladenine DNA glycosylase/8-oxoguanine DNA glycosylase
MPTAKKKKTTAKHPVRAGKAAARPAARKKTRRRASAQKPRAAANGKARPAKKPELELLYDPREAIEHLAAADRHLGRVIRQVGAFDLTAHAMRTPFEALLRAIVYQQLSGKAAATIYGRLEQAVAVRGRVRAEAIIAAEEARLRGAGLSRAKVASCRDLAAKTLDGTVPTLAGLTKLTDDAIVERLTSVRGIGRWSVEMLLMFRLGRPDVLPAHDLGIRKGFQITFGGDELPKPTAILEYGERWRPYRTVASWYLWRAVDHARQSAKGESAVVPL